MSVPSILALALGDKVRVAALVGRVQVEHESQQRRVAIVAHVASVLMPLEVVSRLVLEESQPLIETRAPFPAARRSIQEPELGDVRRDSPKEQALRLRAVDEQ